MAEEKSSSNATQDDGGWKRERTEAQKKADRILAEYYGRQNNLNDPDNPFVGVAAMMRDVYEKKKAAKKRYPIYSGINKHFV